MIRRITASPARSASVTGSKSLAMLLSSIDSEVRKNGRMTSPEEVARRPMKAEKSMTVTSVPWVLWRRARADGRKCLAQIGLIRTGIGSFSAGILHTGRARFVGVFSDNESDHEIERSLNLLDNFSRAIRSFFVTH